MPESRSSNGSLGARALFQEWERSHKAHPPTLYHYTSAQGLLSMVRSGHIWATESRYMNDPREFLHGAEVILAVVDRLLARRNAPPVLKEVRQSAELSDKALRLFVEDCGYGTDQVALRRSLVPFRG